MADANDPIDPESQQSAYAESRWPMARRCRHRDGPHPSPARSPELAFPQQLNPDLEAQHWRPRFIDYLYLGLTNSLAFSPTDVMPLVPWAKIVMGVQSLISLVILGLVVARAANVLT